MLENAGIRYVRIDGATPTIERNKIVKRFQEDPNTKLLLMTTGTGAVGYEAFVFRVSQHTEWANCTASISPQRRVSTSLSPNTTLPQKPRQSAGLYASVKLAQSPSFDM